MPVGKEKWIVHVIWLLTSKTPERQLWGFLFPFLVVGLIISNTFFTFTGTASYFLFRGYQMPYKLNGKCVTVVAFAGLHFSGISFINIRSQSRLEGNNR